MQNLKGDLGSRLKLWIQAILALLSSRKLHQFRQLPEALTELEDLVNRLDASIWDSFMSAVERGDSELRASAGEWKQLFLAIDIALDNVEQAVNQRREGLAGLLAKYNELPAFRRTRYANWALFDPQNSTEAGGAQASPSSARKLASFLIPASRQDDVIGDITELYQREWLPLLGPTAARWCSIWHVITACLALRRIAVSAAVLNAICRILGR